MSPLSEDLPDFVFQPKEAEDRTLATMLNDMGIKLAEVAERRVRRSGEAERIRSWCVERLRTIATGQVQRLIELLHSRACDKGDIAPAGKQFLHHELSILKAAQQRRGPKGGEA